MKAEIAQIEKHLAAIRTVLALIRNRPFPDMPDAFIVFCAKPFLQDDRWMVLACLESLLGVECQRIDSRVQANRFADTLIRGPSDYWTRNPISEGSIDTAVELGILDDGDKELLLKEHSWDLPRDSDPAPLIDELENEVRCIQSIVSRCSAAQPMHEPPAELVNSRPSTEVEPPNPDVNDTQIRKALETRFKGSLEREIDGTLGKILVFRLPPNTDPERVAVKTVNPARIKASASLGAVERFTHEIRHWIKYRHSPLILTPFFTAIVHGWPYVAMPYCERTLRDYIDRQVPRRGQAEAVALMVQTVTALEYAAQYGLLAHQDLKPENILLQDLPKRIALSEGYPFIWRARLADFGLANAYAELNLLGGSRPYLAPEQYELNADLAKVDVFACGVMLHELLTGLHPIGLVTSDVWPEPRTAQSPRWRRQNKWKRWAQSTDKLSPEAASQLGEFRRIIEGTLRTEPGERPSLHELQRELLDALKRLDHTSYENLILLLAYFYFMSVHSAALSDDEDVDQYQLKYLEQLTQ